MVGKKRTNLNVAFMKYVITDQGEVNVGGGYHYDLARDLKGHVVAAGHCRVMNDTEIEVFGESIGFGIKAKPEDAKILKESGLPFKV